MGKSKKDWQVYERKLPPITRIRFLISTCRLIARKYPLSNEIFLRLKELEMLISDGTRLIVRRVFVSDSLLHRRHDNETRKCSYENILFMYCEVISMAALSEIFVRIVLSSLFKVNCIV